MDPSSVSLAPPARDRGTLRRLRLLRRIRLNTLLFLIVILALLFGWFVQKRREAQLWSALALYRDARAEGIYDVLAESMALGYPEGAPLDEVLKLIKQGSTGQPKLPAGIPIYVDPLGLQEAGKNLEAPVKRPESADHLTLGEHLRRILGPLGLGYEVKSGFLMITSKESLDVPGGDKLHPYLQYRDVLR
jgi:hypothetical protein